MLSDSQKHLASLSAILTRSVVVVGFHMRSEWGPVVFLYVMYFCLSLISSSSYVIIP